MAPHNSMGLRPKPRRLLKKAGENFNFCSTDEKTQI